MFRRHRTAVLAAALAACGAVQSPSTGQAGDPVTRHPAEPSPPPPDAGGERDLATSDPVTTAPSPHPTPPAASAKEEPVDFIAQAERRAAQQVLIATLPRASAVFVGTLVEVGPPPGHWSGYNMATQALTYDVRRVLSGKVVGDRVTVHQVLVGPSPITQGHTAALRDLHTRIGQDYVVVAGGVVEGLLITAGEGFAPEPATPELVAAVEAALGAPGR